MKRYSPSILEEIKDRTDIVQVVSKYVPLKRTGRNFKGLCPFHTEKTPSFTVSPDKQFFHCFGCGASGDIFQFFMKMENLTFVEAVEGLAEQVGVDLPSGFSDKTVQGARERFFNLHRDAASLFHRNLLGLRGEKARKKALARGLDSEIWETFQLGYAPDSWDRLRIDLKALGHSVSDMVAVGLLGERESGGEPYARFRDRLMIPIWDSRGRVVAFGGRALETQQEPKYLNSPEHMLFQKGDILYPYHMVRQQVDKKGFVLLVEGYMDAICCHFMGFPNALAAMGTAFTNSQARKVVRLSTNVVLAYDGDEAGTKAAVKTSGIFFRLGVVPRVMFLPSGEDPDSYLRSHGPEAFGHLLDGAQDAIVWFMDQLEDRYSISDPRDRSRWLTEVMDFLKPLDGTLDMESYLLEVSARSRVPVEHLRSWSNRSREVELRPPRFGASPSASRVSWEMLYLALALLRPEWKGLFRADLLQDSVVIALWEKVKGAEDFSVAFSMLEEEERGMLVRRVMDVPSEKMEEAFLSCHGRAERRAMEKEARELRSKLSRGVAEGQDRRSLIDRYISIMKSIKSGEEGGKLHETN